MSIPYLVNNTSQNISSCLARKRISHCAKNRQSNKSSGMEFDHEVSNALKDNTQ